MEELGTTPESTRARSGCSLSQEHLDSLTRNVEETERGSRARWEEGGCSETVLCTKRSLEDLGGQDSGEETEEMVGSENPFEKEGGPRMYVSFAHIDHRD